MVSQTRLAGTTSNDRYRKCTKRWLDVENSHLQRLNNNYLGTGTHLVFWTQTFSSLTKLTSIPQHPIQGLIPTRHFSDAKESLLNAAMSWRQTMTIGTASLPLPTGVLLRGEEGSVTWRRLFRGRRTRIRACLHEKLTAGS